LSSASELPSMKKFPWIRNSLKIWAKSSAIAGREPEASA
jgi:hypothetical protein